MKYLLNLQSNGLSLNLATDHETIKNVKELQGVAEYALWDALDRETENGKNATKRQKMLDLFANGLTATGMEVPEGCLIGDLLANLEDQGMWYLLTADSEFPMKLEPITKENDPQETWESLTSGLLQTEADWM